MTSTIKVNNIQNQCGANIANKCGSTITLGASGDTITLACGASQTGFGRTGTVDWDTTAKTASFTAVSGTGYFVNTTSGAITVTLPAGSAGDIISLADYAATWQTNAVTVTPNGTDKIGGVNVSTPLSIEGQSVTFVYVDSTQGWLNTMDSTSNVRGNAYITATGGTITTCGDYKIHTFTGPGTFAVTNAGIGTPCAPSSVDYLVVAGGGGGGKSGGGSPIFRGGAGGAGGFRESGGTSSGSYTVSPLGSCVAALPISVSNYPIVVGAGGAGFPSPSPCSQGSGCKGSDSSFSTITSTAGGAGQGSPTGSQNGGSGGGQSGGSSILAGTGNTPPVSPPQGNPGGQGYSVSDPFDTTGGGGGGATAAGTSAPPSATSGTQPGGAGATTSITTSSVTYSRGGDGGGPTPGASGSANTGDGGFAGGAAPNSYPGGSGGSGIVVIRYKYQ